MWTCPKCGREFKRTNQGHYCGKAPESVDEYIELQIPEAKTYVVELRNLIRRCVPEVRERIAWSMPFFEKDILYILLFVISALHQIPASRTDYTIYSGKYPSKRKRTLPK